MYNVKLSTVVSTTSHAYTPVLLVVNSIKCSSVIFLVLWDENLTKTNDWCWLQGLCVKSYNNHYILNRLQRNIRSIKWILCTSKMSLLPFTNCYIKLQSENMNKLTGNREISSRWLSISEQRDSSNSQKLPRRWR